MAGREVSPNALRPTIYTLPVTQHMLPVYYVLMVCLKACIHYTQVPDISFDFLLLEQIPNCFVLEFQKQVPETGL